MIAMRRVLRQAALFAVVPTATEATGLSAGWAVFLVIGAVVGLAATAWALLAPRRRPRPAAPPAPAPAAEPAAPPATGSRPPAASKPGVFVSYRRQDEPYLAHLLADRLREHLGEHRVFLDVDSIELGRDYREAIEGALASCGAMLVLMGDQWLESADERGRRRLDSPADYVRLEIETALRRGIRIIPVVVDSATMPDERELPESLADLAYRQAQPISNRNLQSDAERFASLLDRVLG
jgi:hypothetical protein